MSIQNVTHCNLLCTTIIVKCFVIHISTCISIAIYRLIITSAIDIALCVSSLSACLGSPPHAYHLSSMLMAKWHVQNSRCELICYITPHMEFCGDVNCLHIPRKHCTEG